MPSSDGPRTIARLVAAHELLASNAVNDIYRQKLGLSEWTPAAASVFARLDKVMVRDKVDYTLFWRLLALVPETLLAHAGGAEGWTDAALQAVLLSIGDMFYTPLSGSAAGDWCAILRDWLSLLRVSLDAKVSSSSSSSSSLSSSSEGLVVEALRVSSEMRLASPKYVLREWMLVYAYKALERGDVGPMVELHKLLRKPYDEQPDMVSKYFRRTPSEAQGKAGTAYMT